MAYLIESSNCMKGWAEASMYILRQGAGANLTVCLSSPMDYDPLDLQSVAEAGIDVPNVAHTIFPYRLWKRHQGLTVAELSALYEAVYERGKRLTQHTGRWGTYYRRFTSFGADKVNQLERIVTAMRERSGQYQACYMLYVSSADYCPNFPTRGGPCLQYVQFAQEKGILHLTAIYRNHAFYSKALGNYIGLSHLLKYVATLTGQQTGMLTCHSIHYEIDQGKRQLLQQAIKPLTS